jgi:hypothetical protein
MLINRRAGDPSESPASRGNNRAIALPWGVGVRNCPPSLTGGGTGRRLLRIEILKYLE